MPGNTEWLLMLLHILLCGLSVCYGRINDETPTIHSISLQNGAVIPQEYKNLPVVGKCCPIGKIFDTNANDCVVSDAICKYSFSPLFHTFNNTGYEVPGDKPTKFVAIVGIPCKYKKCMLDPDKYRNEKNILLLNGSVFAPDEEPSMLKFGVDYCMENLPGIGLRTFMCLPEITTEKDPSVVTADSRYFIFACSLLIPVPFLILTIAAYCITPQLRDVYGKALCRYCACLALAFFTLAITQLGRSHLSERASNLIAFVLQFSYIACFFWLNAMCIEMWLLVRGHVERETYKRMKPKTLFFYYSLWCWGPSMILMFISLIVDLGPTIPIHNASSKALTFFYVPIGLLFLGNVILFVLTFIKLSNYQKDLDLRRLARNEESDRRDRRLVQRYTSTVIACLIIFSLMALNWSIELLQFLLIDGDIERDVLVRQWSICDLMNTLQGIVVFYLFVIRKPQKDFVWHRIQQLRGVHTTPLQVGSMEAYLLPMVNGDTVPGQTIIS